MSPNVVPPRRLWWLLAGFSVWCSALVVIYTLHAIGCAFGWPAGSIRLALAVVIVAHVAAIGWLWRGLANASPTANSGDTAAFVRTVGIWSLIAALATVVLTLGPVILLKTCV